VPWSVGAKRQPHSKHRHLENMLITSLGIVACESITAHNLNVGKGWRTVVSCTSFAALHPGARAGLDPTEKRQSFPPAGNQTQTPEKANSYIVTMVTEGRNVRNKTRMKLRSGFAWLRRESGEGGSGQSNEHGQFVGQLNYY
jgi:hypothetical protein